MYYSPTITCLSSTLIFLSRTRLFPSSKAIASSGWIFSSSFGSLAVRHSNRLLQDNRARVRASRLQSGECTRLFPARFLLPRRARLNPFPESREAKTGGCSLSCLRTFGQKALTAIAYTQSTRLIQSRAFFQLAGNQFVEFLSRSSLVFNHDGFDSRLPPFFRGGHSLLHKTSDIFPRSFPCFSNLIKDAKPVPFVLAKTPIFSPRPYAASHAVFLFFYFRDRALSGTLQ